MTDAFAARLARLGKTKRSEGFLQRCTCYSIPRASLISNIAQPPKLESFSGKLVQDRSFRIVRTVRIVTVTRQRSFQWIFFQVFDMPYTNTLLGLGSRSVCPYQLEIILVISTNPFETARKFCTVLAKVGLLAKGLTAWASPIGARAGLDLGTGGGLDGLPCRSEPDATQLLARHRTRRCPGNTGVKLLGLL